MSTIQINIPDCAVADNNIGTNATDSITIDTSNCPAQPLGPPAFITLGPTIVIAVVALILVVATAIVRYRAHELRPDRIKAKNQARQIELDAEVKMAALRKRCTTCGDIYEPAIDTA